MKPTQHTDILECARDCYLFQHGMQPTRFRDGQEPSTLDLVFTNEENMVNNISYSSGLGTSDHLIITFQFICYTKKNELIFTISNYFQGNYTTTQNVSRIRSCR